jgi:hypothetical protein
MCEGTVEFVVQTNGFDQTEQDLLQGRRNHDAPSSRLELYEERRLG